MRASPERRGCASIQSERRMNSFRRSLPVVKILLRPVCPAVTAPVLLAAIAVAGWTTYQSLHEKRMCHRARAAHGFKFLQIGAPADDFRLPAIQSDRLIQLSEFHGRKPVVLIFASFTCNIFSKNAARLEQLYQAFKNRAEFLFVYIKEAEHD